jgi:hypothetical protein
MSEVDTWNYWTSEEVANEVPENYVWERLRINRNRLLQETDYKLIVDAPWEQKPWIDYRQLLRDLPKVTKNPRLAEWPVSPE